MSQLSRGVQLLSQAAEGRQARVWFWSQVVSGPWSNKLSSGETEAENSAWQ